jgi:hypothetical protein
MDQGRADVAVFGPITRLTRIIVRVLVVRVGAADGEFAFRGPLHKLNFGFGQWRVGEACAGEEFEVGNLFWVVVGSHLANLILPDWEMEIS